VISGDQALMNTGAFVMKEYYQQLFSLSLPVPEKNAANP
jgi:hypothetical protein